MSHPILEAPGIRADLTERIGAAAWRYKVLLGAPIHTVYDVGTAVDRWMRVLGPHEITDERNDADAVVLLHQLTTAAERRDPTFWASPLGRALAWWTGGEEAAILGESKGVHRSEARAALGISRQAVQASITERPRFYDPHETSCSGISAAGLRRAMRERYPL